MREKLSKLLCLFLCLTILCSASVPVFADESLPVYDGQPYVELNSNIPGFSDADKQRTDAFETYSELDSLGRCGVAYANICKELQPTEERGNISSVHPTGWQSNMGWERCHLIGFQLAGENANVKNLITGTNYFNHKGMLPFENLIDDYVEATDNHVLYRVTPIFEGDNLIASGVQMEAWSVEDNGEGICFNVYAFNVQPGKTIDYATGIVTDSDAELSASTVTLSSKTATYSGKAISIGTATVTGSTGAVTYTYYTDSDCTSKTTTASGASASGKAPKNVGTYYVIAEVASDGTYASAKSSKAKLTIKKGTSTITLKSAAKGYTGKAVTLTATVTGSKGAVTYTYYTDKSCKKKTTTSNGASATGKAPKYIGTYYVKASVAGDSNCTGATSSAAKLVITKGTQKITVSTSSKSYKYSDVKSSAKTFSIGAKATAGSVTCSKSSGSSCLSVSSNGKVTVKKGTKAGTYTIKVKISAASTSKYNSATATKTITVKIVSSSTTKTTTTVYWTDSGTVYHKDRNCSSLSRSTNVHSGTIAQSGKERGCKNCC